MRHLLIGGFASAVVLAWLFALPSAAVACSPDSPTFAEAINGARTIARVTVVEGSDAWTEDPSHSETYRVERILKGDLPDLVTVAPAWTSICHDTIGAYAGSKGKPVVVAFDVRSYGEVIHPVWVTNRDEGVLGTAGVPGDVATLAELERAILAKLRLPDTSTGAAINAEGNQLALFTLATVFIALAITVKLSVTRAGARRTH